MRVAIAGGGGFIGRALTAELTRAGHDVVWLSRRPGAATPRMGANGPGAEVAFDWRDSEGPWVEELARADAVVNLSGHPIASRWTAEAKRLIRESRVDLTTALVDALLHARAHNAELGLEPRPTALVNASAVGVYGDRGDDELGEGDCAGGDWLALVARDWESAALQAAHHGVRVVTVRNGLVLGAEGVLPPMVKTTRLFAGGWLGTGRQWFPWVHLDDIAGVYRFAIENDRVSGPVNAAGPEAVRMRDFARTLGRVLHRPVFLPVPVLALRLVLGPSAPTTVMSQRISERRLLGLGYSFRFASVEEALRDLLEKRPVL